MRTPRTQIDHAANNPSDSRSGGVNSANFNINQGRIYGNVTPNGGNVKPSLIGGTIDKSVAFPVPVISLPSNPPTPQSSRTRARNGSATVTPPMPGSASDPAYYMLSALTGTPTIAGSQTCYGNSNTSAHYDRALNGRQAIDHRISSDVENTR